MGAGIAERDDMSPGVPEQHHVLADDSLSVGCLFNFLAPRCHVPGVLEERHGLFS